MAEKDKCYFCEEEKEQMQNLYVFASANGKHVPVQAKVCAECKAEYEATFPKDYKLHHKQVK